MPATLRSKNAILLALLIALLAACSGPEAETTTSLQETTTSTTAAPTTAAPTTAAPTTAAPTTVAPTPAEIDVQNEIDWFVEVLNGEDLDAGEYEARFSDEFRQEVPYEAIQPILDQFRPAAPWEVVDRSGEGARGVVRTRA